MTSLSPSNLADYVSNQLNCFFPDGRTMRLQEQIAAVSLTLERVEFCFKHSAVKRYFNDGQASFNHLFSDQYAAFVWFLGNTLWQANAPQPLLDKLFYLNKTLHAFECMYDTQMPAIFFLSHTVGTVLGKATYADFLVVSQGCTVGTHRNVYPVLGKGVGLGARVSIIGDCKIGDRVSIGSDTAIFQQDIGDDTTVYTSREGQLTFRAAAESYAQKFFNVNLQTVN